MSSQSDRLITQIEAYCGKRDLDWHAELTAGSAYCWSCKLTVVLTPNRDDGPDRSLVTFAGAGGDPEEVLGSAWRDMRAWLEQAGPGVAAL